MLRSVFRRAAVVQPRAFFSKFTSPVVLRSSVSPSSCLISRRLFATVQDVASPTEESSSVQDDSPYEPSREYFSNFHNYVTSEELPKIPATDIDKLQKVSEMMNRMNMYFMLHMRRKNQSLEDHDDGNAEAGVQYLEHFSSTPTPPFTQLARLREIVMDLHLTAIDILKAIPHNSSAIDLDLSQSPGELPSFKTAIDDLIRLAEPIDNVQTLWQMVELRERILRPDQLPDGLEPVQIVPDAEKAALDVKREADEDSVDNILTESEKNTLLQETAGLEDPEEFLTAWAPLWNDLVFVDTVLNAYLSAKFNSSLPIEKIRESLYSVMATREQEMNELTQEVEGDQVAEADQSECAEGVFEAAETGEEKSDLGDAIDMIEKAERDVKILEEVNPEEKK